MVVVVQVLGTGGNALTGTSGDGPAPGTDGNGAPSTTCGGGGGGFYTSGGNDESYGFGGGQGFRQGGAGGTYSGYQSGGFGGGACADYVGSCNIQGGAGGGYSGGSGLNSGGYQTTGYGGGSYNGGTSQSNSVGNTGNGQVTISCNGGCPSDTRTLVTVTVNQPPTDPTGISGTTTICNGSSTLLTAIGGSENSGCTYQWFTGSCGGTQITGASSSITVSPPSTTTYYVRRVGNSPCGSVTTACASVTVTVNTLPDTPSEGNINVMYDGSPHAGTATVPTGFTVVWYTAATGGTVTGPPSGTNVGVYTAWAESVNDLTGCISATRTQVTVNITPVTLGLKVMLQGPYNSGTGLMKTDLNTGSQIPSSQPFNTAPWNYNVVQTATPTSTSVDWVLVELRSDMNTVVGRRAGLLNNDGTVTLSIDDINFPLVHSGESYYIVVWHRNHMPVMSAIMQTVPVTSYDLTVPGNLYGNTYQ